MTKKILYLILVLIAFISVALGTFYRTRKNSDPTAFIKDTRHKHQQKFDSMQRAFKYELKLRDRIEECIIKQDFQAAYALIDSLPASDRVSTHLYRGMIYAEQKNYSKALEEYNMSMSEQIYPIALEKRAELYIKMNKFELAIGDYKQSYDMNYDYSLKLGDAYMLINKKDSAQKYYQIFLEHYPQDSSAHAKLKSTKRP